MGRAYKQVSIQYNCRKFYSFILLISCDNTDYRGRPLAQPKNYLVYYCLNEMQLSVSLSLVSSRQLIEISGVNSERNFLIDFEKKTQSCCCRQGKRKISVLSYSCYLHHVTLRFSYQCKAQSIHPTRDPSNPKWNMEKYENEQLHQNGEKKESCICNQGRLYINQKYF